jgi:hypothetical protein
MDNDDDRQQEMEEEDDEEQLKPEVAELAEASVPNQIRGIRACKRCGILKTLDQFINEGCENCPFLDLVCIICNEKRNDSLLLIIEKGWLFLTK